MSKIKIGLIVLFAIFTSGMTLLTPVQATDWPNDTITILVGQKPGSGLDVSTRLMADAIQKELGVAVVVKNVPGAGGRVAYTQVYNAKPDGYLLTNVNVPTICIGEIVFGGAYKTLEFQYIYGWTEMPHVLAVTDDSPIKSLKDLIEKLKKERTTIATFGHGTSSHLQIAVFAKTLGVENNLATVHFSGGPRAMAALVGKNVDAAIIGSGGYARRPQNVRGLAYFAPKPDPYLSDHLKTVHELGYTQVPDITLMIGMVAPPHTPEAIVKKLSDVCVKVAKTPELQERFRKLKTDFSIHDYKDFRAFAKKRYEETKEMKEYLKK